MKSLKDKSKLLVEQILNENFLDASSTLKSLVLEAEENREEEAANEVNGVEATDEETSEDGAENTDEAALEVNTDDIDEPSNGSPGLGDSLDGNVEGDDSIEDQSVGEGEMTEMSNDIVEINCEINQKIISKLYDKISNLKTALNAKDVDHDTREYITLETKLSYYGNKLEELQSKTNPAIDQSKVEERINIIDAALKSLEAEIGDSSEVPNVESSMESEEEEGDVDSLGDQASTEIEGDEDESSDDEGEENSESEESETEEETDENQEK